METAETRRERHLKRDLAVYGLLGACRVIADDRASLGAGYQHEQLKRVVAECEAKLAALEEPMAVAA